MEKFRTMKDAAQRAVMLSKLWFVPTRGLTLDAEGLKILAESFDEEFEEMEGKVAAFLCSREGALGVTFSYEYNARWLVLPLPSETELVDEAIDQMQFQLNNLKDASIEELEKIWKQQ